MHLVTGGAGFIGAHTVWHLRAHGARVRVLDDLSAGRTERLHGSGAELVVGRVEDAEAVAGALAGVEVVIHLAARVSVPGSWADPAGYVRTNVEAFARVLDLAHRAGVRRVVYASSCAVYGSTAPQPVPETAPVAPESPYAATKAADEALAAAWTARGLPCLGLRYFNVFGPGQDPSGPYGAVLPTFVSRALRGEPLVIDGDGAQGRDFVSVRDVAVANARACGAEAPVGVLNVGSGRRLTVAELARRVAEAVPGTRVVHGPARLGDVRDSCADTTRAAAAGIVASVAFDAELATTLRWLAEGADHGAVFRSASAAR
jgi:UDP-glucose 4-epimerase